jgi:hypothetical protein
MPFLVCDSDHIQCQHLATPSASLPILIVECNLDVLCASFSMLSLIGVAYNKYSSSSWTLHGLCLLCRSLFQVSSTLCACSLSSILCHHPYNKSSTKEGCVAGELVSPYLHCGCPATLTWDDTNLLGESDTVNKWHHPIPWASGCFSLWWTSLLKRVCI